MTRLEIAVRLLAGAWSDFPEEASDAELAESALNMADALLDWMLVQAAAAKGAK